MNSQIHRDSFYSCNSSRPNDSLSSGSNKLERLVEAEVSDRGKHVRVLHEMTSEAGA